MFLTLEDPRAKVKGSRDPLGTVPIGAAFARHFVTNLTTSTSSVRGFTTLLLGRYYGEKLIDEGRATDDDALPIFLQMEQIAGYVRHEQWPDLEGPLIRGIERIRRNRAEYGKSVPIGLAPGIPIMSNQRVYGLWGLYSVAARTSGLLADGPVGLTNAAREFFEEFYRPELARVEDQLERLVLRGGRFKLASNSRLAAALAGILKPTYTPNEYNFYGGNLRDAERVPDSRAGEQQRVLAELIDSLNPDEIDRPTFNEITRRASRRLPGLARSLDRARRLSALLAPADLIFRHLLGRDRQTLGVLADDFAQRWDTAFPDLDVMPFEEIADEAVSASSVDQVTAMAACDRALLDRDWEAVIESLLDWNQVVMTARGSAPWARLEGSKLDVRFHNQEERLPEGDQLSNLWRKPYFIDSLKSITEQLAGKTTT